MGHAHKTELGQVLSPQTAHTSQRASSLSPAGDKVIRTVTSRCLGGASGEQRGLLRPEQEEREGSREGIREDKGRFHTSVRRAARTLIVTWREDFERRDCMMVEEEGPRPLCHTQHRTQGRSQGAR